jgi:hypothetical protein
MEKEKWGGESLCEGVCVRERDRESEGVCACEGDREREKYAERQADR